MKLTLEQFQQIAIEHGWEHTGKGNTYRGVYGGYPLEVTYKGGVFGMAEAVFRVGGELPKSVLREVKAAIPSVCSAGGMGRKDTLYLCSAGEDITQGEHLLQCLNAGVETLRRGRIPAPEPQKEPDADRFPPPPPPPPPSRAAREKDPPWETARDEDLPWEVGRRGSWPAGLVGALLLGCAGAIPGAVLFGVFSTWYGAPLFALVPMSAAWGFRRFGRKAGGGGVAVALVCAAALFLAEWLVIFCEIHRQLYVWPTLAGSFRLYLDLLPTPDVLYDLFVCAALMVVGWCFLGRAICRRDTP